MEVPFLRECDPRILGVRLLPVAVIMSVLTWEAVKDFQGRLRVEVPGPAPTPPVTAHPAASPLHRR
jgi:hypothetical protein